MLKVISSKKLIKKVKKIFDIKSVSSFDSFKVLLSLCMYRFDLIDDYILVVLQSVLIAYTVGVIKCVISVNI